MTKGVPTIEIDIFGQGWQAIVDTGFNGDLELPERMHSQLSSIYMGRVTCLLAGDQEIEEDVYFVYFPFDGQIVRAQATFVQGEGILIGTRMLREYQLRIDFPAQSVSLGRVQDSPSN